MSQQELHNFNTAVQRGEVKGSPLVRGLVRLVDNEPWMFPHEILKGLNTPILSGSHEFERKEGRKEEIRKCANANFHKLPKAITTKGPFRKQC